MSQEKRAECAMLHIYIQGDGQEQWELYRARRITVQSSWRCSLFNVVDVCTSSTANSINNLSFFSHSSFPPVAVLLFLCYRLAGVVGLCFERPPRPFTFPLVSYISLFFSYYSRLYIYILYKNKYMVCVMLARAIGDPRVGPNPKNKQKEKKLEGKINDLKMQKTNKTEK